MVRLTCKFQRSLLTQLRIDILPLAVETGRYYRIALENRIAKSGMEILLKMKYIFSVIAVLMSMSEKCFFQGLNHILILMKILIKLY